MRMASHLIAIDWQRDTFRAWLAAPDGTVLREIRTEDGVRLVQREQFAATLNMLCGAWLGTLPEAQVVISGMAGGPRGWVRTPHLACPADAAALRAGAARVRLVSEHEALLLPGLSCEDGDGAPDAARGKECPALGAGIADGVVCVPGGASFWADLRGGSVADFATYMTEELEALLRGHPALMRVGGVEEEAGFALGLASATRETERTRTVSGAQRAILPLGGAERPRRAARSLPHLLQNLRAAMTLERMNERHLGPHLAGLLIGDEVRDALAAFGSPQRVHLVAEGLVAARYGAALTACGVEVVTVAPSAAFTRGAAAIAGVEAAPVQPVEVAPPIPRFVFEGPFGL